MDNSKKILFLLLVITVASSLFFTINRAHAQYKPQDKLIATIDLIRHGERTPIKLLSSKPYREVPGSGEMTARGLQQAFILGTQLREKYINQYHFLC